MINESFRWRWRLLSFVAFAFLVRVTAIGVTGANSSSFGDADDYVLHAVALCEDGRYPDRGNNRFFRPPGLPSFLAISTACHVSSRVASKLALAAVDSLTVVLVGLLAQLLWRDRRAAFLASGLAAVYPPFVLQTTDVQSEPLFMFLLSSSIALVLWTARKGGGHHPALLAGLALGAASLTRPVALAAVAFASAAVACTRRSARSRLQAACLVLVGAGLVVGPWAYRNSLKYGEAMLVNDAAGINLWRGATPLMKDVMTASSAELAQAANGVFNGELLRIAEEVEERASLPQARSRLWRKIAISEVRADWVGYLSFSLVKLQAYWRPWLNPRFHSPASVLASAAAILPLMVFGGAGLWRLRRADPWSFYFILAFFALGCVAQLPFQTVMRFRVPFTDPLLIALASWPVWLLFEKVTSRLSRKLRG